jgi:hypothetical protein
MRTGATAQNLLLIAYTVHRQVVTLKPVSELRIAMCFWPCNGQMSHRIAGEDQRERDREREREITIPGA